MTSPLHDLVTGIIKQVINIKLQDFMDAKEVFKVSWMKIDRIGNIDAIGFANSVIESNDARNTLISANYAICGFGASVYTESAGKAVYYPNMVIDFIDKISTL